MGTDAFDDLVRFWGEGGEVPGHCGFVAQANNDLYVARCTCGWIDPRFFDAIIQAQVVVDLHELDVATGASE